MENCVNIEIFDYGMNGEGVAKLDGKTLFVQGALRGEKLTAEVTSDEGNYAYALMTSVSQPSPERVSPPCPYFEACGGCDLMHMTYAEQLRFKSLLVKKTIKKITGIDPIVQPCVGSEDVLGYRNKSSFALNDKAVGFYRKGSHDVLPVAHCLIASPDINKVLDIFNTCLKDDLIDPAGIKNLVVRAIDHKVLVAVVASAWLDIRPFYLRLAEAFSEVGLSLFINTRKDSVVLSGKVVQVGGIKKIKLTDPISHIKYDLDIQSFHQTNQNIQNKIYQAVLDMVGENARVVNGFSGAGVLSAMLAQKVQSVHGIEIEPTAHQSANQLKKDNKVNNLTNIKGDFIKKFLPLRQDTDVLVLDPSKRGLGEKTAQQIVGVGEIIYISCSPQSLAKDLRALVSHYDIVSIQPYDMFPNTANVETLVHLRLKSSKK